MNEMNGTTPNEKKVPNMQVSVERLSDIERKVDVEIPWDDVKGRLDEAYNELKQGVSIKGFRKGKVPRRMLEQLFGKHVVKEVAQRLVQDSIGEALNNNDISAVSEPKVEDNGIQEGECFKYSASLQVIPEIEPKDYFGIDVKMRKPQATDEAVELALQAKQKELTAYQRVEGRNTQENDILLVDVMGKMGEKPVSFEKEIVELTSPPREPIHGLAGALTGIPCDQEELNLELDVPEDAEAGEQSPMEKARLLVTVREVNIRVVPEIDDEFAKDTGEAETLAELKDNLRKKILEEDREQAQNEAKETLLKQIAALNEVPIVPGLVERKLNQSLAFQKMILGLDRLPERFDEDALKESLRDDAVEAVKHSLLLTAIAKKEKVEVTDADLEKRFVDIAQARNQNVARVRAEYEKEGLMKHLRDRIAEEKTLDLLMTKANLIEEEVQVAEKSEPTSDGENAEVASEVEAMAANHNNEKAEAAPEPSQTSNS